MNINKANILIPFRRRKAEMLRSREHIVDSATNVLSFPLWNTISDAFRIGMPSPQSLHSRVRRDLKGVRI